MGPTGQILCQFGQNKLLAYSAKNLKKSGGFLSRKRKVVVDGNFLHQSGGFMLWLAPHLVAQDMAKLPSSQP